jgi:signal transduction histidine kinase
MHTAEPFLPTIAAALLARTERVLQRWQALADEDAELTTASNLSRSQFRDHIPLFLEAFSRRISALSQDSRVEPQLLREAASHGVVRWQQGYRPRELMREWRHLHVVLVEELEDVFEALSISDPTVITHARRQLAATLSDGVCESATHFASLQQAEAEARLRDLEQAHAELRRLQQLNGDRLHQATHDLRGGLGAVDAASRILQADAPDSARDHALRAVQRGVTSMQELLDELIELARLEAGRESARIAPFDAADLLRGLAFAMSPLAEARGLVLIAGGADSLMVEGDAAKVRRVVQNLVHNALRYTREGRVTLSWSWLADDKARRWTVTVHDTGPGFAIGNAAPITRAIEEATVEAQSVAPSANVEHSDLDAVSATVRHAADVPPGEGIGLAIVKRLCELLDAQIELRTEMGVGSEFRITFPSAY